MVSFLIVLGCRPSTVRAEIYYLVCSLWQVCRIFIGMKVDFLVCGTQKGGTTALDLYLRGHPEVCMANVKEVHFFDRDDYFKVEIPDYSYYHSYFSPGTSTKVIGESTPIYMYWRTAPMRIWKYNSAMKIIILLRDPISRAYSHWNMERSRGAEESSFWEAVRNETARSNIALPYQHRVFSYVDRGFYVSQIKALWSFFGESKVLILRSEILRQSPKLVLDEVSKFLSIKPFECAENEVAHLGDYPGSITLQEREYLNNIFESEIKELEKILGWDCSNWLSG